MCFDLFKIRFLFLLIVYYNTGEAGLCSVFSYCCIDFLTHTFFVNYIRVLTVTFNKLTIYYEKYVLYKGNKPILD